VASQFGPYKLIRQVAVGGMAEIHLAKTAGIAGFEKYVAIKMIHPNFAEDEQFIQMLVDEAKIAVQLTHGNIAQTFDLGRVGDTYYITMEYVDGADLYKILRRASEQDLEMPLDVCAFISKEISSALDHAHRKRDHTGKSLGIVHRDVSPQNVLVSYSGEVKLVDFGIAKATMKARQTAVGVIKGKYYYMSPEQARGDLIDYRSDIFSAGIVLYEMITGQMLYLEEDLHKLLEMARAADIAPPSRLRKGVPPQLERIVMRALAKQAEDRYQSAGDFALDLERFLHAYSPVFTSGKLSNLLRQVVGEPLQVPNEDAPFEHIEFRDGVMSTHPLDASEVAHAIDRDELRDENSVIFRMSDLDRQRTDGGVGAAAVQASQAAAKGSGNGAAIPTVKPSRSPTPPPVPAVATGSGPNAVSPRQSTHKPTTPSKPALRPSAPRETRATDALPALPARPAPAALKVPSIPARPTGSSAIPRITKPRQAHEETRQLEQAAPANPLHDDSSGLLTTTGQKLWSDASTESGDDDLDELDNIGERTLVTIAPGASTASVGGLASFMMDVAGDDTDGPVEATLVTMVPGFGGAPAEDDARAGDDDLGDAIADAIDDEAAAADDDLGDDMPTLSGRDLQPIVEQVRERVRNGEAAKPAPRNGEPGRPAVRTTKTKTSPPAALAARIHAPAVSELRKPRPSRRTPPGGVAPPPPINVLQAIVSSQASEPMPAPRPSSPAQPLPPPPAGPSPTAPPPLSHHLPTEPSQATSYAQAAAQQVAPPPVDPYAAAYAAGSNGQIPAYHSDASGLPLAMPTPQGMHPYSAYDPQAYAHQGYVQQQLSPQALYGLQPNPQPVSLTGQLRLMEVDELPAHYRIASAGRRWFTYVVSGLLAVSVAAAVTFLIIRSLRDNEPAMGAFHIDSVPQHATVEINGKQVASKTPVTIENVPVGRHTVRITLAHRKPYEIEVDVPRRGGDVNVVGSLEMITGKMLINSVPAGAEIWINNRNRGRTPATITGLDPEDKIHVELRLKDYQPYVVEPVWPENSQISIDAKLSK
jgi:serine/threonine protein kinase